MFDQIPLACLLNKKFLLVHGGISHDLKTVIDRFREIPKNGLFCDLMWADPVDNKNGTCEGLVKHN
jgi:serine/threonine-protein phosphatase 2B catalytic subunit